MTTSLESVATSRLVDPFAARLEVLAFDAAAADHAADIRAELERRGQTIGGDDLLPACLAERLSFQISPSGPAPSSRPANAAESTRVAAGNRPPAVVRSTLVAAHRPVVR